MSDYLNSDVFSQLINSPGAAAAGAGTLGLAVGAMSSFASSNNSSKPNNGLDTLNAIQNFQAQTNNPVNNTATATVNYINDLKAINRSLETIASRIETTNTLLQKIIDIQIGKEPIDYQKTIRRNNRLSLLMAKTAIGRLTLTAMARAAGATGVQYEQVTKNAVNTGVTSHKEILLNQLISKLPGFGKFFSSIEIISQKVLNTKSPFTQETNLSITNVIPERLTIIGEILNDSYQKLDIINKQLFLINEFTLEYYKDMIAQNDNINKYFNQSETYEITKIQYLDTLQNIIKTNVFDFFKDVRGFFDYLSDFTNVNINNFYNVTFEHYKRTEDFQIDLIVEQKHMNHQLDLIAGSVFNQVKYNQNKLKQNKSFDTEANTIRQQYNQRRDQSTYKAPNDDIIAKDKTREDRNNRKYEITKTDLKDIIESIDKKKSSLQVTDIEGKKHNKYESSTNINSLANSINENLNTKLDNLADAFKDNKEKQQEIEEAKKGNIVLKKYFLQQYELDKERNVRIGGLQKTAIDTLKGMISLRSVMASFLTKLPVWGTSIINSAIKIMMTVGISRIIFKTVTDLIYGENNLPKTGVMGFIGQFMTNSGALAALETIKDFLSSIISKIWNSSIVQTIFQTLKKNTWDEIHGFVTWIGKSIKDYVYELLGVIFQTTVIISGVRTIINDYIKTGIFQSKLKSCLSWIYFGSGEEGSLGGIFGIWSLGLRKLNQLSTNYINSINLKALSNKSNLLTITPQAIEEVERLTQTMVNAGITNTNQLITYLTSNRKVLTSNIIANVLRGNTYGQLNLMGITRDNVITLFNSQLTLSQRLAARVANLNIINNNPNSSMMKVFGAFMSTMGNSIVDIVSTSVKRTPYILAKGVQLFSNIFNTVGFYLHKGFTWIASSFIGSSVKWMVKNLNIVIFVIQIASVAIKAISNSFNEWEKETYKGRKLYNTAFIDKVTRFSTEVLWPKLWNIVKKAFLYTLGAPAILGILTAKMIAHVVSELPTIIGGIWEFIKGIFNPVNWVKAGVSVIGYIKDFFLHGFSREEKTSTNSKTTTEAIDNNTEAVNNQTQETRTLADSIKDGFENLGIIISNGFEYVKKIFNIFKPKVIGSAIGGIWDSLLGIGEFFGLDSAKQLRQQNREYARTELSAIQDFVIRNYGTEFNENDFWTDATGRKTGLMKNKDKEARFNEILEDAFNKGLIQIHHTDGKTPISSMSLYGQLDSFLRTDYNKLLDKQAESVKSGIDNSQFRGEFTKLKTYIETNMPLRSQELNKKHDDDYNTMMKLMFKPDITKEENDQLNVLIKKYLPNYSLEEWIKPHAMHNWDNRDFENYPYGVNKLIFDAIVKDEDIDPKLLETYRRERRNRLLTRNSVLNESNATSNVTSNVISSLFAENEDNLPTNDKLRFSVTQIRRLIDSEGTIKDTSRLNDALESLLTNMNIVDFSGKSFNVDETTMLQSGLSKVISSFNSQIIHNIKKNPKNYQAILSSSLENFNEILNNSYASYISAIEDSFAINSNGSLEFNSMLGGDTVSEAFQKYLTILASESIFKENGMSETGYYDPNVLYANMMGKLLISIIHDKNPKYSKIYNSLMNNDDASRNILNSFNDQLAFSSMMSGRELGSLYRNAYNDYYITTKALFTDERIKENAKANYPSDLDQIINYINKNLNITGDRKDESSFSSILNKSLSKAGLIEQGDMVGAGEERNKNSSNDRRIRAFSLDINKNDGLRIISSPITKNTRYQQQVPMNVQGLMLHSVGVPQPNAMSFINQWNPEDRKRPVAVHGVIDANTGDIYQAMPWNIKGWHAGGKANNTHIGVEIAEPSSIKYTHGASFKINNLTDAKQATARTYKSAVDLFAFLSNRYNLDPLKSGVIISHNEGHKLGVASGHVDPEHLWKGLGMNLSMNKFRTDVKNRMSSITSSLFIDDFIDMNSISNDGNLYSINTNGNEQDWSKWIYQYSNQYNIDPELVSSLIMQESAGNPKAVSKSGARGLMQLMPIAESDIKKRLKLNNYNIFDPETNIKMGINHLAWTRDEVRRLSPGASWIDIIRAYNKGAGGTARWINSGRNLNELNKEQREYPGRVLNYYGQHKFVSGSTPIQNELFNLREQAAKEAGIRLANIGVRGGAGNLRNLNYDNQYMVFQNETAKNNYHLMHPILRDRIYKYAKEFFETKGKPIVITSTYRSFEHQKALYDAWINRGKTGYPVGKPNPFNRHTIGTAIDLSVNSGSIDDALLSKYHLRRPWPTKDAVHVELEENVLGNDQVVSGSDIVKRFGNFPAQINAGTNATELTEQIFRDFTSGNTNDNERKPKNTFSDLLENLFGFNPTKILSTLENNLSSTLTSFSNSDVIQRFSTNLFGNPSEQSDGGKLASIGKYNYYDTSRYFNPNLGYLEVGDIEGISSNWREDPSFPDNWWENSDFLSNHPEYAKIIANLTREQYEELRNPQSIKDIVETSVPSKTIVVVAPVPIKQSITPPVSDDIIIDNVANAFPTESQISGEQLIRETERLSQEHRDQTHGEGFWTGMWNAWSESYMTHVLKPIRNWDFTNWRNSFIRWQDDDVIHGLDPKIQNLFTNYKIGMGSELYNPDKGLTAQQLRQYLYLSNRKYNNLLTGSEIQEYEQLRKIIQEKSELLKDTSKEQSEALKALLVGLGKATNTVTTVTQEINDTVNQTKKDAVTTEQAIEQARRDNQTNNPPQGNGYIPTADLNRDTNSSGKKPPVETTRTQIKLPDGYASWGDYLLGKKKSGPTRLIETSLANDPTLMKSARFRRIKQEHDLGLGISKANLQWLKSGAKDRNSSEYGVSLAAEKSNIYHNPNARGAKLDGGNFYLHNTLDLIQQIMAGKVLPVGGSRQLGKYIKINSAYTSGNQIFDGRKTTLGGIGDIEVAGINMTRVLGNDYRHGLHGGEYDQTGQTINTSWYKGDINPYGDNPVTRRQAGYVPDTLNTRFASALTEQSNNDYNHPAWQAAFRRYQERYGNGTPNMQVVTNIKKQLEESSKVTAKAVNNWTKEPGADVMQRYIKVHPKQWQEFLNKYPGAKNKSLSEVMYEFRKFNGTYDENRFKKESSKVTATPTKVSTSNTTEATANITSTITAAPTKRKKTSVPITESTSSSKTSLAVKEGERPDLQITHTRKINGGAGLISNHSFGEQIVAGQVLPIDGNRNIGPFSIGSHWESGADYINGTGRGLPISTKFNVGGTPMTIPLITVHSSNSDKTTREAINRQNNTYLNIPSKQNVDNNLRQSIITSRNSQFTPSPYTVRDSIRSKNPILYEGMELGGFDQAMYKGVKRKLDTRQPLDPREEKWYKRFQERIENRKKFNITSYRQRPTSTKTPQESIRDRVEAEKNRTNSPSGPTTTPNTSATSTPSSVNANPTNNGNSSPFNVMRILNNAITSMGTNMEAVNGTPTHFGGIEDLQNIQNTIFENELGIGQVSGVAAARASKVAQQTTNQLSSEERELYIKLGRFIEVYLDDFNKRMDTLTETVKKQNQSNITVTNANSDNRTNIVNTDINSSSTTSATSGGNSGNLGTFDLGQGALNLIY